MNGPYKIYTIAGSWEDDYSYYMTYDRKSSACNAAYELYRNGTQCVKIVDAKGNEVEWDKPENRELTND